jgi:hypothetical protein
MAYFNHSFYASAETVSLTRPTPLLFKYSITSDDFHAISFVIQRPQLVKQLG